MAHFAKAPSPGLRPTSPPGERCRGGAISAQHHLSLWGRGRRVAVGEGAFPPLELIGKAR